MHHHQSPFKVSQPFPLRSSPSANRSLTPPPPPPKSNTKSLYNSEEKKQYEDDPTSIQNLMRSEMYISPQQKLTSSSSSPNNCPTFRSQQQTTKTPSSSSSLGRTAVYSPSSHRFVTSTHLDVHCKARVESGSKRDNTDHIQRVNFGKSRLTFDGGESTLHQHSSNYRGVGETKDEEHGTFPNSRQVTSPFNNIQTKNRNITKASKLIEEANKEIKDVKALSRSRGETIASLANALNESQSSEVILEERQIELNDSLITAIEEKSYISREHVLLQKEMERMVEVNEQLVEETKRQVRIVEGGG